MVHNISPKGKLNEILFTIYLSIAAFAYVFVYVTDDPLKLCLIMIPVIAAGYVLSCVIFKLIRKISLKPCPDMDFRRRALIFAVSFCISFAVMMIWYGTYFPGSFGSDAAFQFGQVVTGQYSDSHPAWHTFIFYMRPLQIFRWRSPLTEMSCFLFS